MITLLLSLIVLACQAQPASEERSRSPVKGEEEHGRDTDTTPGVSLIVDDLSSSFDISRKNDPLPQGSETIAPTTQVSYRFVSREPVKHTPEGGLFLRADYSIARFDKAALAAEYYRNLEESAHPDMGLSYAWDYLLLRQDEVHQLHAACTFSQANFEQMIAGLGQLLGTAGGVEHRLYCRCGGGCGSSL